MSYVRILEDDNRNRFSLLTRLRGFGWVFDVLGAQILPFGAAEGITGVRYLFYALLRNSLSEKSLSAPLP